MPLLFCVLDDGLSILRIDCVQDIEEVGAVDSPASRHVVREEACELGVIRHLWTNVLQGQFIVERYCNEFHLVQTKEMLPFCKHILQKVLVQADIRRQVKLHCTEYKLFRWGHLHCSLKNLMKSALLRNLELSSDTWCC